MLSRILVVDDDAATCELIQEVLKSSDKESFALTSSRDALACLTKEKFEAVFVDVHMPAPDGIELTKKARASGLNRTTPIMVITGEDDHALLARAFDAGATFFLFKPLDRNRILSLLRVTQDSIEQEKRRFRRVMVRCNVVVEMGQERFTGATLDLSAGGMFVQTSGVFPLNSAVRLTLQLNSGTRPLSLAGRVLRVAGNDCMGLQFENLGHQNIKSLQEFLVSRVLTSTN